MLSPTELEDLSGLEYPVKDNRQLDPGPNVVVRCVGSEPIPVRTSLEPPHLAHYLGRVLPSVYDFIEALGSVHGPIVPELNFSLFNTVGKPVVDAIDKVIHGSTSPTPSGDLIRPVMHVPTITAAYAAMDEAQSGSHILVVAGSASEVERFDSVRRRHYKGKNFRIKYLLMANETGYHLPVDIMCEFTRDYVSWMMDPRRVEKYDVIFLAHSMGKLFEQGGRQRSEVYTMLRSMTRGCGTLWGIFYDVDAMKQLSTHGDFLGSTEIRVLYEEDIGTEGASHSQLGNRSFLDFRFTEAGLARIIDSHDESGLWSARFFCSEIHKPPKEIAKAAIDPRLEPIRIWRVRFNRVTLVDSLTRPQIPWERALIDLGKRRSDFARLQTPTNRGRPFTDMDLFYLSPDRVRVTPKADGIEALCYFDLKGDGWLALRGSDIAYSIPWKGPNDTLWQVEMIPSKRGGRYSRAVVGDIMHGAPYDHGYYTRMLWAGEAVHRYKLPFTMPPSTRLTMNCELPPTPDYPSDGYVLNWDYATTVRGRDGSGNARYIKHRYTYEAFDDDGELVERYIDDGSYRLNEDMSRVIRRDKFEATSTAECESLRRAWSVSQFVARVTSLCVPPHSLEDKLIKGPQPGPDPFMLEPAELAFLYCPFRAMEIEARLYKTHGAESIQALALSKAIGIAKVIKDNDWQYRRPDPVDRTNTVISVDAMEAMAEYARSLLAAMDGGADDTTAGAEADHLIEATESDPQTVLMEH